ncbi:ribonuclease H-like domain-containing protein [Tanacetum coccineum]
MPSRPNLFFAGLDDSVYKTNVSETISSVPRIESTTSKSSKDSLEQPKDVRPSAPIIEEWESDSDDDCVIRSLFEQNKPSYAKINFVKSNENTRKFVIEQHTYRQPKNLRKSQSLRDCNFYENKMVGKSVLNNMGRVTGQREVRPVWNNAQRVNHQNKLSHPHPKRNFVPTAVATKSRLVPVNAAKQSSPRAATSISTARHVNTAALKPKVNNVTTTRPEVVVSTAEGKRKNVVKSSACCIRRPTGKDQGIFDSGYSWHMTVNKSHLTDYQDINGGFVAFAGSPKGGKITRKGKIRTGKLDFEDVYFVKEHKFNLFSISQMYDKKNSVLFTKTECLVLSPDFKLLDESQVLLKVPRQDHMYSFDLKNVVPSEGLTFLFAKATIDESNLWHRRLGHINFKTMNKLVRGNLVRGLHSKLFENDHSCVAYQKGKQHKAYCKTKPAEAVNTACYVQNRVLVTKPHNKTPYELLLGRPPSISFMRPFGCPVTILNTLDPLGKFDGKADEGFLVGYSINSKAFRVFNTRTRKVEENLHINFLENKPNVAGSGPEWLFDIDSLTKSMNYEPVTAGNQTNGDAGIETNVNAGQAGQEKASDHEYILLPLMLSNSPLSSSSQSTDNKDADEVPGKGDDDLSERNGQEKEEGASNKEDDQHVQDFRAELDNLLVQQKEGYANNTNRVSTVNPSVSAAGQGFDNADDQERIDSSTQDVNTAGPSINTAQ